MQQAVQRYQHNEGASRIFYGQHKIFPPVQNVVDHFVSFAREAVPHYVERQVQDAEQLDHPDVSESKSRSDENLIDGL